MRQALGEYDDDGRSDEFELVGEQREDDGYAPPDRRLPAIVVSMLAMALFAGGLWLAYHLGTRHAAAVSAADSGAVPVIRADQKPDKVRPEQPGGLAIPDQNVSIYNEKPGVAPVEQLLPPPEKPLPRPEPLPSSSPAPQRAAVPSPVGAAPVSPASVEPLPAAVPAPRPAPVAVAGFQARPQAAGEAKPALAAPRVGSSAAVHVRLASVRSPDAARSEWERLKHANADLLGRLSGFAVRTDLGDKGIYYRVEAGPFADAAAAERLCSELRQRKLGCILGR